MKPTIFPRILTTTALCLAAVGLNSCTSCNACSWLTAQCQQKASYTYSAFSLPEVAAIRFVDKQGNVLCEYENKRGDTIRWIKHSFAESPDGLPIYVITTRHYNKASSISSALATSLLILACADILIATMIYIKKSKGRPLSM